MNDPKSMESNDLEQVGDAGPDLDTVRGALSGNKAGTWESGDSDTGAETDTSTLETESVETEKPVADEPTGDLNINLDAKEGEAESLSTETEAVEGQEETVEGTEPEGEVEYFSGKRGEQEYKVPKDAEFEITIDGKKEILPLQKILSEASGKIHVGRELGRLGYEKKQLIKEKETFQAQSRIVQENAEMLMQMENPFEFCAYFGMLKQQDPGQVWNALMEKTATWAQQFETMSESEQKLAFENSMFKFREKIAQKQQKIRQTTEQKTQRQQQVAQTLQTEGVTPEDFQAIAEELMELDRAGQFPHVLLDQNGNVNELQVVNYAIAKKFENRIKSSLDKVNPKLREDSEFFGKIATAVLKTEALSGESMTDAEVIQLVKLAREKTSKRLSESLSKKAEAAKSKPATTTRQKTNGALTLEEHRSRRYPEVWE